MLSYTVFAFYLTSLLRKVFVRLPTYGNQFKYIYHIMYKSVSIFVCKMSILYVMCCVTISFLMDESLYVCMSSFDCVLRVALIYDKGI